MKTRKLVVFIIVFILFFTIVLINNLQAQDFLICSKCGQKNEIVNKFCIACGDSLDDEYKAWLIKRNEQRFHEEKFISGRVDPPRLFSVPTARVLGSKDISLMGGGAFGVAMQRSILGTVGIGLGNIAEVEFSTVGLINNIAQGSPTVTTSAFKIQLIPENLFGLSFFPALAVSIRSSANWKDIQSDWSMIRSNSDFYANNPATGMDECAINSIGYNTRFTIMYGVTTIPLGPLHLHAGLSLTDVRVKEASIDYIWLEDNNDPEEKQKNLIGGFLGFDIEKNPQTKIMFEAKTVSNHEYNMDTKEIEVSHTYVTIGGVRFFFTKWLSIDTGVLYQTNYKGIADSQIKLGLNLFLPTGSISDYIKTSVKQKTSEE